MSSGSLYEILELNTSASTADIKRAYHRLALKYHPDKNIGSEDKFRDVQKAYNVLSNDEKRFVYDRYGELGLEMMEKLPWLNPSIYHRVTVFSIWTGVLFLVLILQLSFLCLRVDRSINWSWHFVLIPFYGIFGFSSLALLPAFICSLLSYTSSLTRRTSSSSSNAASHPEEDENQASYKKLAWYQNLLFLFLFFTFVFFLLLGFVLNKSIAPSVLIGPYVLIEATLFVRIWILFRVTRSTMPLGAAIYHTFFYVSLRYLQAIFFLVHFSTNTMSWPVVFLPSYFFPLPWCIDIIWILRSPPSSKLKLFIHSLRILIFYYLLLLLLLKLEAYSISLAVIFIPFWILLILLFLFFVTCVPLAMTLGQEFTSAMVPVREWPKIMYTESSSTFSTITLISNPSATV